MSKPAKTIFIYGLCVMMPLGAWCLLAPVSFLHAFALPPTQEPWIRVVGFTIFGVGFYYVYCALHEQLAFARVAAFGRIVAMIFFTVLAFAYGLPTIIIFGLLDLAGGIWTFWAFRATAPVAIDAALPKDRGRPG
jgi:hypothetical protein